MTHPIASQKIQAELAQHSKAQSSALPKLKSLIKGLTLPAVLILVCEYLVRAGFIEPYLLPAPSSLWLTLTELAAGDLWQHIWASSWRVFAGFAIGSLLALVFAVPVGLNKQAEDFLEPSFSAIKSIPSLAWIPLLLLWQLLPSPVLSDKISFFLISVYPDIFYNLFLIRLLFP